MTPEIVSEVSQAMVDQAWIRSVQTIQSGKHLRMVTGLRYPDGTPIEVFLADRGLFRPTRLTDFGQTVAWLHDVQVFPRSSKKRLGLVEESVRGFGVQWKGAAFECDLPENWSIPDLKGKRSTNTPLWLA
jgi:hypothetical protein